MKLTYIAQSRGVKGMPRHVDEIFLDTNGPQNNLRTSHHTELKERSVGRSRDVHRHFRRRPPVRSSVAARFSGRSFRIARCPVKEESSVENKSSLTTCRSQRKKPTSSFQSSLSSVKTLKFQASTDEVESCKCSGR